MSTPSERQRDYEQMMQNLIDNGFFATDYTKLHHIVGFANDGTYIGIYQTEDSDIQFPLISNTKDLEYSQDGSSETIASEINKLIIATPNVDNQQQIDNASNTLAQRIISTIDNASAIDKDLLKNLCSYLLMANQTAGQAVGDEIVTEMARADRLGTLYFASFAQTVRMQSQGLMTRWNENFYYTINGYTTDNDDIVWKSDVPINHNNEPSLQSNKWKRKIKLTDKLTNRNSSWQVIMADNSRIIILKSAGDFINYPFTREQADYCELSFIATSALPDYPQGSSYILKIDDVEYKLFSDTDEQKPGSGDFAGAGKMVKIYFNKDADGGNGAFFVLKTSGDSGTGSGREIGDIFWSEHELKFDKGTIPYANKANGGFYNLSSYPNFTDYLLKLYSTNNDMFAPTLEAWVQKRSMSKFNQIGQFYFVNNILYCWSYNANDIYTKTPYHSHSQLIDVFDEDGVYQGEKFINEYTLWPNYTDWVKSNDILVEEFVDGFSFTANDNNTGNIAKQVTINPSNDFEIVLHLKLNTFEANNILYCLNANGAGNYGIKISTHTAVPVLNIDLSSNGTTADIGRLNCNIVVDIDFWIKINKTGEIYTLLTSTDGIHYTSQSTVTSSSVIYTSSNDYLLYNTDNINTNNTFNTTYYLDNYYHIKDLTNDVVVDELQKSIRNKPNDKEVGDAYVYLPDIKKIRGGAVKDGEIQKQEVPTGTMTAMTLINYLQLDGAFTASPASSGYTGGNGFKEIRGRNFTYDPQKAGDNSFAEKGVNVEEETIKGYFYIVMKSKQSQANFAYEFQNSVATYSMLPSPSINNKNHLYYVNDIQANYVSNGDEWCLIQQSPFKVVNPFALGMSIQTPNNITHPSWIKSDTYVKSGVTYSAVYNVILDVWENGVEYQTTIEGMTYTYKEKNGYKVLSCTDWSSIYNTIRYCEFYGINTEYTIFNVPLPNNTGTYTYYYAGETLQDPNLINVASLLEKVVKLENEITRVLDIVNSME